MTSFQIDIDPRKRKRGRFINKVRKELQKAVAETLEQQGATQADLARLLGVNRSVLSRRLNGSANLTLSSIADLAWALDRDLNFSLSQPDYENHDRHNQVLGSPIDIKSDDVAEPQVSREGGSRFQSYHVAVG